jgi:hypothetical protein
VEESRFNNGYPLVKINKVAEIDTHFNIIFKVVRINKEFRLGPLTKIEFIGGDETGIAIVVLDK